MRKIGSLCLVVLLFLLILSVFLIFCETVKADPPADVYVDDDFDGSTPGWGVTHFDNIQNGTNNVSSGGNVYIWDGTYYGENITINNPVSLIGNGTENSIIEYKDLILGAYSVISILSENVSISGLHFNNSTNHIIDNFNAFYCANTTIINCLFTNSSHATIDIYYPPDDVPKIPYINISNNIFENNPDTCIQLKNTKNCLVSYNNFNNSFDAIDFIRVNDSIICYNYITNETGYGAIGIDDCAYCQIYNNTCLYGLAEGIWFTSTSDIVYTHDCSIYNNIIIGFNENYGILFYGSYSRNNLFYNNYLCNNLNAYDEGNNIWNVSKTRGTNIIGGPYLGGNYWSDYTGNDTNHDGLGDTDLPYNSSDEIANGGDYLPLTTFVNLPPNITEVYPVNDSIDATRRVQCHINVTDPDNDTMVVSFYENTTGNWILQYTETVNGTVVYWNYTDAKKFGTTYWWKVIADDGVDSTTSINRFTIRDKVSKDEKETDGVRPLLTGELPPPAGLSLETISIIGILIACIVLTTVFVWIYYKK